MSVSVEVDDIAREIYQAKSQSPRPMTDERWARIKSMFPSSVRVCYADAEQMLENGEFDE